MNTTDVCAISASRRSRSCTRFVSTSSIVSYQQVFGGEFEIARADLFDVGEVLARHVGQRDVEDVEVLAPNQIQQQVERALEGFEKDLERLGRDIYRSCGSANSGSPYSRATATPSTTLSAAAAAVVSRTASAVSSSPTERLSRSSSDRRMAAAPHVPLATRLAPRGRSAGPTTARGRRVARPPASVSSP